MNARTKGNDYERKIRKELRSSWWPSAETSRFASKMMDDLKVDLVNTKPFSIQCKAVEKMSGYHQLLASMPQDENYNVIFHKKNQKGEIVVMTKDTFYELVGMLKNNNIL
jgi:hypothetical protein